MGNELEGMVILLAGGASGIGRECALAYAREGATIAILDRNFEEAEAPRKNRAILPTGGRHCRRSRVFTFPDLSTDASCR
jgi:NAD(P)-dependent dehydrogenase (short-subunit alcohol dehydrogenase family)